MSTTLENLLSCPKERKSLDANGFIKKKKGSPDGTVRYKARLVAKGYA